MRFLRRLSLSASDLSGKMEYSVKNLNEIADNIYSGLCCFIKLKTREIKTILNFDS